jgi:hypothetical protein
MPVSAGAFVKSPATGRRSDLRQLAPVVDQVQGLQLGGLANYLGGQRGKPAAAQKPY